MAAHITWNGHAIGGLERGALLAYSDMSYSLSTKTKAKDGNDILYIGRQGYNAAKFEVTIAPNASLGQDVEEVITGFKNDSRSGVCARILLGGRDLFGADYMLTGVSVSDMKFQPKTGRMVSAKIHLTWQESDGQVYDNTSSSASTKTVQATKGTGSKYIKDKQSKGEQSDEVDAISGADGKSTSVGKSGSSLIGLAGGFDPKGILEKAKKILPPSTGNKK